ncbi:MAG: glyceraldehyde 3-phosphate dehydrogenase, partial [Candidatus Azotimanducaceae bacterium]
MGTIRIGMMGFGQIGRQLYKLALQDKRFEVVAISDIGRPEILTHLLDITMGQTGEVQLVDNYLVSKHQRTRLMSTDHPVEIPWDLFEVDVVIDATGRFRSAAELEPHLGNGAKRVFTSALPEGNIDRVVLYGVNHDEVSSDDRIISAGSASTTATALALKIIAEKYEIEHATMTSVHAYTSDQSLRDYAGA